MKPFYSIAGLLLGGLLLADCTRHKDPEPTAEVAYAGVIRDYWTERPVAGVPVYLGKANVVLLFGLAPRASDVLDSARTDAQGRFVVQSTVPRQLRNLFDVYGFQLRPQGWYFPAGQDLGTQTKGQDARNLTIKLERRYELRLRTQVLNPAVDSFALTVRPPFASRPQLVSCGRRYADWPCPFTFPLNLFPPNDTSRTTRITYRSYARRQLLRTDSVTVAGTRYLLSIR